VVRREAGGEPVVTDIAACREYTLNLDLQRLPILEELGKDDRDNFDMFGPLGWAAIYYARAGIPVFPLAPGSKIPHKGSAGVKDATTDTRRIRPWRRRHPNDNIGLACGVIFDALDIDCKDRKPGYESLTRLRLAGLTQGAWATAHTPTGGRHVLFAPSGEQRGKRSRLPRRRRLHRRVTIASRERRLSVGVRRPRCSRPTLRLDSSNGVPVRAAAKARAPSECSPR
jgi:hypothetical protein